MIKADWVWHDGEMVAWDDAHVHLTTHSLHYGFAAFEGIRCYPLSSGGAAVFRLRDHIDRLLMTSRMCMFEVPFTSEQIQQACVDTVAKNRLTEGCYIRPLVFMGAGQMGIAAMDTPIHVSIMAWRWGTYLGEEGLRNGIRCCISSFRRMGADTSLPKGKITGQYVNSILAKREAVKAGYEEAIMLDGKGQLSEGTGENLFWVRGGKVYTPPVGESILEGITRDTAMRLLRDEGTEVVEAVAGRDTLYVADEIFLTGTAAEVTPVREVDDRTIGTGKPGPVTQGLQKRYQQLVCGELEQYSGMLTVIPNP